MSFVFVLDWIFNKAMLPCCCHMILTTIIVVNLFLETLFFYNINRTRWSTQSPKEYQVTIFYLKSIHFEVYSNFYIKISTRLTDESDLRSFSSAPTGSLTETPSLALEMEQMLVDQDEIEEDDDDTFDMTGQPIVDLKFNFMMKKEVNNKCAHRIFPSRSHVDPRAITCSIPFPGINFTLQLGRLKRKKKND